MLGTVQTLTHRMPLLRMVAAVALLGAFGSLPLAAKHYDDVVVMKNGDRFTGEIKKLENGVLYFSSAYMVNAVELDWARVERLESQDEYNVRLTNGWQKTGSIEVDPEHRGFSLRAEGMSAQAQLPEVVSIVPVETTFMAQLTGSIDYGFSFTGGSNATQSNLSSTLAYLAEYWGVQLNGSSVFSSQTGAERSGRNTVDFLYTRYVNKHKHWFVGATSTYLNSQQQDLKFRATVGAVAGRDFVKSGTTGFLALGGIVFSQEEYTADAGDQPRTKAAESQFQIRYYKTTFKKLQFSQSLAAYPSLTAPGRVRMSLESALNIEIVRNLRWKLSLYENYDNRPPVNAKKNDFGTSMSLGWKF
jgi:putative salt-induced outer membrane protein YdiY